MLPRTSSSKYLTGLGVSKSFIFASSLASVTLCSVLSQGDITDIASKAAVSEFTPQHSYHHCYKNENPPVDTLTLKGKQQFYIVSVSNCISLVQIRKYLTFVVIITHITIVHQFLVILDLSKSGKHNMKKPEEAIMKGCSETCLAITEKK